jgi:hypothetical protein
LRKYEEALRQLALALPLTQRSGDRRFEAYTLIRMGMVYIALNEPRKALDQYEKALAIQQRPAFKDSRGEAMTLDQQKRFASYAVTTCEPLGC